MTDIISEHNTICDPVPSRDDEALLRQALEALDYVIRWDKLRGFRLPYKVRDPMHAAIKALRERLK